MIQEGDPLSILSVGGNIIYHGRGEFSLFDQPTGEFRTIKKKNIGILVLGDSQGVPQ